MDQDMEKKARRYQTLVPTRDWRFETDLEKSFTQDELDFAKVHYVDIVHFMEFNGLDAEVDTDVEHARQMLRMLILLDSNNDFTVYERHNRYVETSYWVLSTRGQEITDVIAEEVSMQKLLRHTLQ